MLAVFLSVPSVSAIGLFGVGRTMEAIGSREFGRSGLVGVAILVSFALIPIATVILIGWAIARWANRGSVPRWLLIAAAGNSLAFWLFYQMTRM